MSGYGNPTTYSIDFNGANLGTPQDSVIAVPMDAKTEIDDVIILCTAPITGFPLITLGTAAGASEYFRYRIPDLIANESRYKKHDPTRITEPVDNTQDPPVQTAFLRVGSAGGAGTANIRVIIKHFYR